MEVTFRAPCSGWHQLTNNNWGLFSLTVLGGDKIFCSKAKTLWITDVQKSQRSPWSTFQRHNFMTCFKDSKNSTQHIVPLEVEL